MIEHLTSMLETLYLIPVPKKGRKERQTERKKGGKEERGKEGGGERKGRMRDEIHYWFAEEHVHIFLIVREGRFILYNLKQIGTSCQIVEICTMTGFHNYNFDHCKDETMLPR